MALIKTLRVWIILGLISILYGIDNRTPQAIDDDVYEGLKNSLLRQECKLKIIYTALQKKIYRLCKSGKYEWRKIYNPVTNKEEETIVSIFLLKLNFFSL